LLNTLSLPEAPNSSSATTFPLTTEQKLVHATIAILTNMELNPYQGSMPSQKVQVKLQQQYPQEYERVIGKERKMAGWKAFLSRHADVFTLFQRGSRYKVLYFI